MDRRTFIRISSVAALPIALGVFPELKAGEPFTIHVDSNRAFGHLIREKSRAEPTRFSQIDTVIVGGGVAGISAAYKLRDHPFRLFEGGANFGGTSGAGHWKTTHFATGAHYELAYPKTFGKQLISTLQELNIIRWNPQNELFEFVEKKYVIKSDRMEQCFTPTGVQNEVMDGVNGLDQFYQILGKFKGEMQLPTRLISKEFMSLNQLSFKDYISQRMVVSEALKRRIDYQMMDDWGGDSATVSALAGIHYYMCRPYDEKKIELFSPPHGNQYFIEKMIGEIPNHSALETNSYVCAIQSKGQELLVDILRKNGEKERVQTKGVIYAGQKHALKYVMPEAYPMFSETEYAPWVVVNIICDKTVNFGKWQNDVLSKEHAFLGFVDANQQHNRSDKYTVLTAYYCFEPAERDKLVEIENNPEKWVDDVVKNMEEETNTPFRSQIKHVNIKLMGHAMPIPGKNYLTLESVPHWQDNVVFAGVDSGRLPLFSEAFDSGLEAANRMIMNLKKRKNESRVI